MKRKLAFLTALAALAFSASVGRAADPDALARWLLLREPATLERFDPNVVELRRSDEALAGELVALASEATRPRDVRERALLLAGTLAEDDRSLERLRRLASDASIGSAASSAFTRAEARMVALGTLGELAGAGPVLQLRADALKRTLGSKAARELGALARDPLLDVARRRLAVLVLPLVASQTDLDVPSLAATVALARSPGDGPVRAAAVAVLRERGPERDLARTLGQLTDDADPDVERAVLESMPALKDEAALKGYVILAIPEGASLDARARAIEALGRTGSEVARPWIERILRDAVPVAEDDLRAAAWSALAHLGGRPPAELAEPLADLLSSPRTQACARALDALATLPHAVVEAALASRLLEPSPDDVRLHAAEAARALEARLAAPLAQLAKSDTASVAARTAAVRALAIVGDAVASADALTQVLDPGRRSERDAAELASLRRATVEALGSPALRGEIARRTLESTLAGDPSGPVRIAAARSLGAQGDAHAAPALVQAIDRSDLSSRERAEIVRALGSLRAWDEATAARVAGAASEDPSPDVALAAADYFAEAEPGTRRFAVPLLIEQLDHADPAVRRRSHAALLVLAGDKVSIRRGVDPFGYDPSPEATAYRAESVKKWREFWQRHKKDF